MSELTCRTGGWYLGWSSCSSPEQGSDCTSSQAADGTLAEWKSAAEQWYTCYMSSHAKQAATWKKLNILTLILYKYFFWSEWPWPLSSSATLPLICQACCPTQHQWWQRETSSVPLLHCTSSRDWPRSWPQPEIINAQTLIRFAEYNKDGDVHIHTQIYFRQLFSVSKRWFLWTDVSVSSSYTE